MSDLRNRYVYMRNRKVKDINFFYDYAIHSGFVGDFEVFYNAFLVYIKYVNIDSILLELDRKFCLTVVFNSKNEFIKVVDNLT